MMGRFSSPRFRRRIIWSLGFALVGVAVVGGSIVLGNTAHHAQAPYTKTPAWVYHEPRLSRLSAHERLQLLSTSLAFVQSAVARRHLDQAYDMAGPDLRTGITRSEWRMGSIPVVPFAVKGIAAWKLDYSYTDDVAFDLALVGDTQKDVVGKTFTIELKRYGKGASSHWLVDAWVPRGISDATNTRSVRRQVENVPGQSAPLGAAWLFVPISVLALIVLVPIFVGTRNWIVSRRAEREYLRRYSSSSSPS